MGIPSIIIMDLTVHKEKVIELRKECRVLGVDTAKGCSIFK